MVPWSKVCKNALLLNENKDAIAYLYGGNGQIPRNHSEAAALVNSLWATYPAHFQQAVIDTGHTKEELIRYIVGKRCVDCSSLVCIVTQSVWPYLKMTKDYNSTGLINSCTIVTTPAKGVAGSVLHKKGHVGVDVGNGLVVDIASEFVPIRLREVSGAGFTRSGQLPWVDYTGASNM